MSIIKVENPKKYYKDVKAVDGLGASPVNYSYFSIYIVLGILIILSIIMMDLESYFFSRSEI